MSSNKLKMRMKIMSMPPLESVIPHYNDIPYRCIKNAKSILDIGSSNGLASKRSKYGFIFDKVNMAGNYLGIDIQNFEYLYYHIIQSDILTFTPTREYDLVIASHLVEHIKIEKWKELFTKLYNCVAKNGYLVVIVPFMQRIMDCSDRHKAMQHEVFQINKQLLEKFLSNCRCQYSKELQSSFFREKGEFLLYAVLRLLYRVITFHPYSILKQKQHPAQMTAIWRKKK